MQSQMRRQAVFTLGMLVFGCLEAILAANWVGPKGVEGVTYSVLLCLVPGWLTIFVSGLLKNSEFVMVLVLVGGGLRTLFVLLGLMVLGTLRRDLGINEFVVWLIASYLVSLVIETWLIVVPTASKTAG